ncbi:MAG: DUF2063 domain-containing protein, partial [Methylobacteriaceae bacterium]|nr:DUF2063 domain-containing protein [Methylobacteriaceae bacterium]
AFAALDPEALPTLRPTMHPGLRLVRSRHAIVSIWAAHQGQGDLAEVDPDVAEDALIVRPALDVETMRLPPGAAAMFAGLLAGQTLGAALEAGFAEADGFDMTGALALLVRSGAVIGFTQVQDEGDAR